MSAVAKLQERAEAAEREAARLRKIAELVGELGEDGIAELVALVGSDDSTNGNGNDHKNGNGHGAESTIRPPRGREAGRQIVRERPGIWTLSQLRAEMERRGWPYSQKGLEVAAWRLCNVDGEGRWLARGQYEFPATNGKEGAIESDASGGAMIPFTPGK